MTTELQSPTDVSPAPSSAAAPAAPAALPLATTIAAVLARMVENAPSEEELERLRTEAAAALTASREADERMRRMRVEIDTVRAAAQPRPDLVEVAAALTAGEIEARVRGIALPADHGARMAQARAAITAAELKRTENELMVEPLEALLPQIKLEATRARDAANRASATYGSALALSLAQSLYIPAVAAALEAEVAIEKVLDQWGGNVLLSTRFSNPATSDHWTRKDIERVIEREIEREAERSQSTAAKAAA